jgi:hypothetical protein
MLKNIAGRADRRTGGQADGCRMFRDIGAKTNRSSCRLGRSCLPSHLTRPPVRLSASLHGTSSDFGSTRTIQRPELMSGT